MKVTIRPMQSSDWASVGSIYQEGIDTNLATFQTECPSYDEWTASHLQCCRLVAVDDKATVLGWAALSPVSSLLAYGGVTELSLYIAADARGKGVGSALMHALTDASEKEGIWTLHSSIMANNLPSIRLHEKCGYRMIGRREKIGRDRDGVWRDTVLMERRSKNIGVEAE